MKKFALLLLLFFVSIVGVFIFRPMGEQNVLLEQGLYCLASLIASISAFLAIMAYGKGPRFRSLLCLAVGVLSWFIADIQFTYYEFILNDLPYPSSADYFFLAGCVLMLTGLLLEVRLSDISWRNMNKHVYLASGIFTTIIFGLFSYLTVFSSYSPEATSGENLVTIGYTVGDLFLVLAGFFMFIVAWEYRGGKASKVWIYLLLGFLATLGGDLIYAIYTDEVTNSHIGLLYAISQYLYISGYLFFIYAYLSLRNTLLSFQSRLSVKNLPK